MQIRINKASDPGAWYAQHVGKILPVERVEINRHPSQGIPEDVYWCREGGTYNPINYVRKSDATECPVKTKPWTEMSEEERHKIADGVCRFVDLTKRVEALSDRELAARVVNDVWGKCVRLGTEEEALLDEMITRFEAKSGIERDEEGRVLPAKT